MARRLSVLVFVAAVLALLVWAGVRNHRARQAAMQQAQGAHITVLKSDGGLAISDSGAPQAPGAALIGKPAPAFTLTDTTGKKVSLAELKGHAVVVNFWATWCGPCKEEMPWFEELSKKYAGQGLVVLGLNQDDGMGREELATTAKKIGVSYPIVTGDENTDKAYGGIDFLPQTFFIDKAGRVVQATAGGRPKDEIEADIQKTLGAM